MHILVTGGAGFIGSHTVGALLERKLDVTVFDNLSSGTLANLAAFGQDFRFVEGDVRDSEALLEAMVGCDAVLHLAALVSVPDSIKRPLLAHEINATGTLNVLEAAHSLGIKRVVLASSAAVYGENQKLPLKEEEPSQLLSPYAAEKYLGEVYSSIYARLHGLSPICLRYFNVFGPRQDPSSPYSGVLSRFIRAVVRGEPVSIFGDGGQTRDFVYVEDVARANCLALLAPFFPRELVFNVGTGLSISILTAFRAIRELAGGGPEPLFEAARDGDIRHSLADIARATAQLGYQPKVPFETGFKSTFAWAQSGAA